MKSQITVEHVEHDYSGSSDIVRRTITEIRDMYRKKSDNLVYDLCNIILDLERQIEVYNIQSKRASRGYE